MARVWPVGGPSRVLARGRGRRRGDGGERQPKGRSAAGRRIHAHGPVVGGNDGRDDGQAEARAARRRVAGGVDAVEPFEDPLAVLGCDALPVVSDLNDD